jgi:hypothetical protein
VKADLRNDVIQREKHRYGGHGGVDSERGGMLLQAAGIIIA